MKRRLVSMLLVVSMVLTLLPMQVFAATAAEQQPGNDNSTPFFTDVKSTDWFYDAVRYAYANGFFNGTSATTYSPNGTMTRSMFVTVLGRMAGIDPADYTGEGDTENTDFSDVSKNAYYAPYVQWAAQFGIVLGTGDGKFSPDAEIDRAQMAVLFVRYFEAFNVDYETDANITTTPADMDSVPGYAQDAVLKLWKQGLLNGDGKNFNPGGNASRAEAATLCMRTDKNVDTWYSEPGVPSERVSVDPDETPAPDEDNKQPEEEQKPEDGSSSSGGSSGGGIGGGGVTNYVSVNFAMGDQQTAITLPTTQTVAKGTAVSSLPTPFKEGVIFLGWYYDAAMTQAAASSDTIDGNKTLYAATMEAAATTTAIETPNYVTKTDVAAGTYTFNVTGASQNDIKFINVTGGNIAVDFTLNSGTVTATLEAGQTYQVELLKDSVTFDGEDSAVRYLNILTAKKEATNASLNPGLKTIGKGNVSGLDKGVFEGLYKIDETNTAAENTTTGTFTSSEALNIGDTVAITDGNVNLNDPTSTEGDVAYVKIISVSGTSAPYTYSYEMADVEDVLFIPDVLPIESGWDTDQVANQITISAANLYTAMANVEAVSLDEGDYLGFINSAYNNSITSAESYGKITGYVTDGDGNYIISYVNADEDEIAGSLDVYYEQDREIELTEQEKRDIETEVKNDVANSGYAEQAAAYLAAVMLESDNLTTVPDAAAVEACMDEIEQYALRSGVRASRGSKKVDVEFDKNKINVKLYANTSLSHLKGKGFRVSIEIPFKVTIGSGSNKVEIEVKANFEEEIILKQKISTKRHKIGFLKYDYSLNASFEVGNYTGIGFTADISTAGEEDESMIQKLEDIMDRMEEYSESGNISSTGSEMEGLAEIYAEVMENANDTWIDIVEVKLFETNGSAFLHIFCWQVKGTFVVSANLAVSMGMSFDYITQKQYNFSVRVKAKTSSNETIDIITPEYNFDFYVVGTIGVRAGIRLEMYVGLISLKLDKIGIAAEAGAYARLWGYFYYHLNWQQGSGKTQNYAGAMLIEIGMYLDIKFVAQLLNSSKLSWCPTIYAHEWPLWSAGERTNVYGFTDSDDTTYTIKTARTLTLPSTTYTMNCMDLKSGDTSEVNHDDQDEKNFKIQFTNATGATFHYNAANNTVTINPASGSLEAETDMIIQWKNAALSFTSKPIQKTIHIEWSDPEGVRYVNFDSNGGSAVAQITGVAGTTVSVGTKLPSKTGYIFEGWYSDDKLTNKVTSVTLPAADSQDKGVTLYAKWTPSTVTYTVEHYLEQLNGTYTLKESQMTTGTTESQTAAVAKTYTGYTAKGFDQQTIAANGSTVVQIYYNLDTYTVTFKDGVSEANTVTKTYKHGAELAIPTFAREGYTFTKWNIDPPTTATETATYTATWEAKTNTITFVSNGGSAVNSKTVETGKKIDSTNTNPARTGYTLAGWFTDQTCTKKWDFANDTVTGPMTLYAKWEGTKYTVTFQTNSDYSDVTLNGSGTKDVTFGAAYGELPTPTRPGYHFLGWYTQKDDSGYKVDATTTVSQASVHDLYAHWSVKKYTLTFDVNGGDALSSNTMEVTFHTTYGELPTPTREDYEFLGWFTEAENGTKVESDSVVQDGADEQTLYAHWKKVKATYTVEHYFQNIDDHNFTKMDAYTQTLKGTVDETTTAAAISDYNSVVYDKPTITQETISEDDSTVVKIYYNLRNYSIAWKNDDGDTLTGDYTNGNELYGTTIVPPDTPTKAETDTQVYVFDGWYTAETGGTKVTDFGTVTKDVTYYARFIEKARSYTIHYILNGGTNNSANPSSYTYGVGVTLKDPIRNGYTFAGWTHSTLTDDGPSSTPITEISKTQTGDITLTAKWIANTYNVTFDANGGTLPDGTANTMIVTYGEAYGTLPTPTIATNLDFGGWYTDSSFTKQVQDTDVVSIVGDHTLYAKWTTKTTYDEIKIGGNAIEVDAEGYVQGYGKTIHYDYATHTLTLNNATIECDNANNALMLTGQYDGYTKTASPVIRVLGTNVVKNTKSYNYSSMNCGIWISSDVNNASFTGDGTLTIEIVDMTYSASDIVALYNGNSANMIIDGPTIIAKAAAEVNGMSTGNGISEDVNSYGVQMYSGDYAVIMKSGSLIAQGGTYAVKAYILDEARENLSVTAGENYDGSGTTTTVEATNTNLANYKYISTGTISSTD